MSMQVDFRGEKGASELSDSFWKSQDNLNQALGELKVAREAGSEGAIFDAQKKVEKEIRIMSTIANISQTIHNMLMKLIDKLNIRS